MNSAIRLRWRALRTRSRAVFGVLAMMALALGGRFAYAWWVDSWPARLVLRMPMAALPLDFAPDGQTFLTTGRDGITTWEVASGAQGETWRLKAGQAPVMGAFSPDGKTYAAATFTLSELLSIELFDATSGQTRATLHTPRRTIAHLSFAADGRTLRAFLGDDPQTQACSSWNPAFGSDLNEVVTWDAVTGSEISKRTLTAPTRGKVTAFSLDGRLLAIASYGVNAINLWDLDADRALRGLASARSKNGVIGAGLDFSDDSRTLAIGRGDGTIELWDAPGHKLLKTLWGHTDNLAYTSIQLAPDARTLALTGYRSGKGSPLAKIENAVRDTLGLNPRYDGEILVLDVATGRRLARAARSTRPLYAPDGRTLATEEPDGTTRLRGVPRP